MRSELHLSVSAAIAACLLAAATAPAAVIAVNTSAGATTDVAWTVADPDFGDYTVTVSGFGTRALSSSNNWYRNSSQATENDNQIVWTVSGLNQDAKIAAFSLGTTQITPSVGSGTTWLYVTTLSGTDVATNAPVAVSRTYTSTATPQAHDLAGDFGNAPAFTLAIDEQAPFSTRTIGTRNFTITAVSAVPEPAGLAALAAGATGVIWRRRR